jgi:hypothetical protein
MSGIRGPAGHSHTVDPGVYAATARAGGRSVRLVRELLVADADPALADVDAGDRARRYLGILSSGLGLRVWRCSSATR